MNKLIDALSDYLAHNKAMPVFLGVGFIVLNYVLLLLPLHSALGFVVQTNLFLHLGIIVGLLGLLVGDAL